MRLPIITQDGNLVLADSIFKTRRGVFPAIASMTEGIEMDCGQYASASRAEEVLSAMAKHFTDHPIEKTWTWTSINGVPHTERTINWYTMPKE